MKFYFIFLFILLLLLFFIPISTLGQEGVGGETRDYYIRVELSQWDIIVYDLNSIEDLILAGIPSDEAIAQSTVTDRLYFDKNSHIYLQVFSMDIQHGISIPDLDIRQTISRRDFSVYTFPIFIDFQSPDNDVTVEMSCHVYCGIGHGNMKFKFVFGEGNPEYGKPILYGFLSINFIILLIFVKKIIRSDLKPDKFIVNKYKS